MIWKFALLLALGALSTMTSSARAVDHLISSWETGVSPWVISGFNSRPTTLVQGFMKGNTEGTFSLGIRQSGSGFSWATKYDLPTGGTDYVALSTAAMDPANHAIAYDVFYEFEGSAPAIPGGTFAQVEFWINDGDFHDAFGVPDSAGTSTNQQISVLIPLNDPQFANNGNGTIDPNASFYQLGFGINGDWGNGDATIYIDNLRIVRTGVIPEPCSLVIAGVSLGLGLFSGRGRRRG